MSDDGPQSFEIDPSSHHGAGGLDKRPPELSPEPERSEESVSDWSATGYDRGVIDSVWQFAEIVAAWDDRCAMLADAFWPGPLTLVLPREARVPERAQKPNAEPDARWRLVPAPDVDPRTTADEQDLLAFEFRTVGQHGGKHPSREVA